jgi:hypothetical protein
VASTGLFPTSGAASSGTICAGGCAGTSGSAASGGAHSGAVDAGVDAAIDWCLSQSPLHLFCEDFDQGVPGKFATKTYGGGSVAADTSDYVSPPQSMWAWSPPLSSPTASAGALVTKTFGVHATRFRLQVDVKVSLECTANADGATLATLGLDTYALALMATSGPSKLEEITYAADGGIGTLVSHTLAAPVPRASWVTLVASIDLSLRTASLTMSGMSALSAQRLALAPSTAQSASLELGAAVKNNQGQSAGCRVHLDNVLFDANP